MSAFTYICNLKGNIQKNTQKLQKDKHRILNKRLINFKSESFTSLKTFISAGSKGWEEVGSQKKLENYMEEGFGPEAFEEC